MNGEPRINVSRKIRQTNENAHRQNGPAGVPCHRRTPARRNAQKRNGETLENDFTYGLLFEDDQNERFKQMKIVRRRYCMWSRHGRLKNAKSTSGTHDDTGANTERERLRTERTGPRWWSDDQHGGMRTGTDDGKIRFAGPWAFKTKIFTYSFLRINFPSEI